MNFRLCKELVEDLLGKRAGPFSPLNKLFEPHLEFLRGETGVLDGTIREVIWNALNEFQGRGKCEICRTETKLYETRGGWGKYCSKKCMNSVGSARHAASELTKSQRGTGIGAVQTRAKSVETFVRKYGAENPSQIAEIKSKRENTFIERFGVNTPLKNSTIKQKIANTMRSKHGGTGMSSKILASKIVKTKRANILESVSSRLTEWKILTKELAGLHEHKVLLQHLRCGDTIEKFMWTGGNLFDPRCPKCHGSSKEHKWVIGLLESWNLEYKINDRSIIAPLELDLVIPHQKIAVEINGLFFHSERFGKGPNYHLNKTLQCARADYQLLHISDFEIKNRPQAVQHMLRSKLGILEKIHARKTTIKQISNREAAAFMNIWHMQGACRSTTSVGLEHDGELVAVMTFGKPRFNKAFDFELLRFASSKTVVGGGSKILKFFANIQQGKTLISYADRRWSNGNMYHQIGFTQIGESKPGYWYYKDGELFHRTKFQRHKLNDVSNLTESEIMRDRGFDRVWDCGTLKYKIKL